MKIRLLVRLTLLGLVLVMMLASFSLGAWADPLNVPQIANFEVLSTQLLRGAQPSMAELKQLSDKGVKTIINLRSSHRHNLKEAAMAKSLNMKYFHVPMGYTAPANKTVSRIMKIINDPNNQPVFIHCRQGADRTGTLIGIYRIVYQHWDFKRAYQEMQAHHFKPWLFPLKCKVASYAYKEAPWFYQPELALEN